MTIEVILIAAALAVAGFSMVTVRRPQERPVRIRADEDRRPRG